MRDDERPITTEERCRLAAVLCLLGGIMLACQFGCDVRPAPTRWAAPGARFDRMQVAESSYKIDVDYDLTLRASAGSPPSKPEPAGWRGTAWVGAYDGPGERSMLVTAGHICGVDPVQVKQPDPLSALLGAQPETYDASNVRYTLTAPNGSMYAAQVLLDDDQDDLCILMAPGFLGSPLPIADSDPPYGERGFYVGAPRGYWGGGMAGLYEITYLGRSSPLRGSCDAQGPDYKRLCDNDAEMMSGPFAGGASGSAMIIDGRVVGVLSIVTIDFPFLGETVPWDKIRALLNRGTLALSGA